MGENTGFDHMREMYFLFKKNTKTFYDLNSERKIYK